MRPRLPALTLLILAAAGCADPFETSFYHLDAPRIVAVRVDPARAAAGDALSATALAYQPGFYAQDDALTLSWFLPLEASAAAIAALPAADPASLAASDLVVLLGEGPDLEVAIDGAAAAALPTEGDALLGVSLTGTLEGEAVDVRAFVSLPVGGGGAPSSPRIHEITRALIPQLALDPADPTSDPALWTASARRGYAAEAVGPALSPGEALRLTPEVVDEDGDPVEVAWLSAASPGGPGTLLPLAPFGVDWSSAALAEGEDDRLSAQLLPAGIHTLAAVATDGRGGGDFALADVALVGSDDPLPEEAGPALLLGVGERLLWAAARSEADAAALEAAGGGWIAATLLPGDGGSAGPTLTDAHLVAGPPLSEDDPYGVAALGCRFGAGITSSLTLTDLALGRCTIAEVAGQEILLDARIVDLARVR